MRTAALHPYENYDYTLCVGEEDRQHIGYLDAGHCS